MKGVKIWFVVSFFAIVCMLVWAIREAPNAGDLPIATYPTGSTASPVVPASLPTQGFD